ncbi:Aste57867_18032 [Aphanomyces stellatus]|uniref:Aste57867_18032 protein n=1 Tax=Aphanomyces stellatus TaxID=120398 RepID=A0A485L9N6_9STRA|nr:hypothetical protein As57867_017970 [Aphanomyces stellatus]VFT94771.1 Aste57867_18032 [Aphanomyces stellatus]
MPAVHASSVLCNVHLTSLISSFQDGLFEDLRKLFALRRQLQATATRSSEVNVEIEFDGHVFTLAMAPRQSSWLQKLLKLAMLQFETAWVCHVLVCVPSAATPQLVDIAAKHGDRPMLDLLHARGVRGTTDALDLAKSLPIVEYLHAHQYTCTTAAMDIAASRGALDILHFLHTARTEGCTVHAMDFAAANGHLDVLAFLHAERQEGCTRRAMELALQRRHDHVVAFLVRHHPYQSA